MANAERPQERLEKYGAAALSDTELLAMLLRSGTAGTDVLALSSKLIASAGSLAGLLRWDVADFRRMPGIGKVKALQLLTVMEVARRVVLQRAGEAPEIDGPQAAADYMRPLVIGLEVEKFWVLCLNRKNRLMRRTEVTSGTATMSLSHPREVFREAIRTSATAVICIHNHPSGDPTPSSADMAVTRQLRDSARIIGIDLHDHVIIGRPESDPRGTGYYSFNESGLL